MQIGPTTYSCSQHNLIKNNQTLGVVCLGNVLASEWFVWANAPPPLKRINVPIQILTQ